MHRTGLTFYGCLGVAFCGGLLDKTGHLVLGG